LAVISYHLVVPFFVVLYIYKVKREREKKKGIKRRKEEKK
jgi:hypothetical protein